MESKSFKSGYIGLVGRTNVGKSTLINKIFDRNIVITSDKAQTTRSRINCIYNTEEAQAIFVDCPGFFKPRNLLGEKLNRIIFQVLDDVDIIIAMVDFPGGIGAGDYYVFEQIKKKHVPKILILNKIDLLNTAGKYSIQEAISKIKSELDFFEEIIPVSAATGENLEKLLKILIGKLPEGPMYYPSGMVTDMPVNKMIAEIIREKLSANLFDELPHSINVEVVNLQKKWTGAEKRTGAEQEFEQGMEQVSEIEQKAGMEQVPGKEQKAGVEQMLEIEQWTGAEQVLQMKQETGIEQGLKMQRGFDMGQETGTEQGLEIKRGMETTNVTADSKNGNLIMIECNIYVEKKSHKAMIIGKSGSMLKKIGMLSRLDIEKLLGLKVFLRLWVKVEENWTRKESYLDRFGY